MELSEVEQMFELHWKRGWGSINSAEAMFIQEKIRQHRPKKFVEIGMASGMSGGLIARFLFENGGEEIVTLDHDNTFFGDKSKENGFLIEKILEGHPVKILKKPFTVSLDIGDLEDGPFDMAFVDANHHHPWPMLDTMCLFPYMCGPKLVIHHDRIIHKNQDIVYGIGPKYLYDQFPCERRELSEDGQENIFAISIDIETFELEKIFHDAIYLPWTMKIPMSEKYVERFKKFLGRNYNDSVLNAFVASEKRFNQRTPEQ